MMYERKSSLWLSIIEILSLIVVVCVLVIIILESKIDKNKAYDYLQQCVCVDINYADATSAKGTAVLISKTEAVSVAHLFDKEIATITCQVYNSKILFTMEVEKINKGLDLAKLRVIDFNGNINKIKFCDKKDINYAIRIVKFGNALGYGISASEGIVSNPYMQVEIDGNRRELINISQPICGGDSGGGVFTSSGKLIGLISFKTTPTTAPTDNLSYIIPSYVIKQFLIVN